MIVQRDACRARRIRPPAPEPSRPIGEIIAELLDRYRGTLTTADKLPTKPREGER